VIAPATATTFRGYRGITEVAEHLHL
jgi:hypothetical protein